MKAFLILLIVLIYTFFGFAWIESTINPLIWDEGARIGFLLITLTEIAVYLCVRKDGN